MILHGRMVCDDCGRVRDIEGAFEAGWSREMTLVHRCRTCKARYRQKRWEEGR